MGKRAELEQAAICLYAEGKEIPQIAAELGVSENTLRKWKKRAGTEWDDARKAARKGYVASFEEVGVRLRRSRELSDRLTGDLKHQGNMGIVLNETIRSMMYDVLNQVSTSDIDPENMGATIGQLNKLTLVLQRAEAAANLNMKREAEIRKQALTDAAEAVGEEARAQGMDEKQAEFWMKKILGVA